MNEEGEEEKEEKAAAASKQRKEVIKSHLVRKKIVSLRIWVMEYLRYGTRSPSLNKEQTEKGVEKKKILRGLRKEEREESDWLFYAALSIDMRARFELFWMGITAELRSSLRRGLLWRGSEGKEEKSV